MLETHVSNNSFDSSNLSVLPVLPAVVEKLLGVFGEDKCDSQALARLVGCDVIMSARMLAVANSAAYGDRIPHPSSLERAIAILGPNTAGTVVTITAIHQSFSRPHGISAADLERFWRHSLMCAHLARRFAIITGYPEPEEAYLCGLLHDLGKLVIGIHHPGVFHETRALAPLLDEVPAVERRLFGVDHCELGAALVETWKLRPFFADAIRFHHLNAEELRGIHPLLRLLHVANALSQEEEPRQAAFAGAETLFGLPPGLIRQARAEVELEVAHLAVDLGITLSAVDSGGDAERASASVPFDRAVYEMALVNAVRVEMSGIDDESILLDAIARCAAILFDLIEVHVFPRDPETGMLRGCESDGSVREIAIDPTGAANVLNRALRERQITHSLSEEAAKAGIIDYQLSRLWRTDGVLCLPLCVADQVMGGVGVGISRVQLPRLLAQTRLLRLFAGAAAIELGELRQRVARRHRSQEDHRLLEQQQFRAVLHEVSNPLTIVRSYLHLLANKLEPSVAREELKVLREETERVSRILLRQTDTGEASLEEAGLDLNGTVRNLGRVLDDALCRPRGIRLMLNLKEGLPSLARGRDAVRQVLLNLVRNAVEALEGRGSSGTITVTTQDGVNLQGRSCVEMAVADDGPGLPSELRGRLFKPLPSTKGGGHAGLGLVIVKNLVEELGGYVIYRPNSGGGTVFSILLPQD